MEIFYTILGYVFDYYTLTLIAGLMVAFSLPKREYFWWRLVGASAVGYGAVRLSELIPTFPLLGTPFMARFLIAYVVCGLVIAVSFDVDLKAVIFCAVAGGLLQHLSSQGWMMARQYLIAGGITIERHVLELLSAIIFYPFGYFLFARRVKNLSLPFLNQKRLVILAVVMMLFVYFSAFYAHNNVSWNDTPMGFFFVNLYDIVICVLCLGIQFGLFAEASLKDDNSVLEELLKQQARQQQISKDNVELIAVKCHDLRKQIALVESMQDSKEKADLLKSLKAEVSLYDSVANTGNETLDVVLTEKAMYCKKHDITFIYAVDGTGLSFLEATDVYALFGNALDNAIEYLETVPMDKRVMELKIIGRDSFVRIYLRNYCADALTFKDGLPVSTKNDKQNHGLGLRSIRYIVEKYEGGLAIMNENERFSLNIVINIPNAA